MRKEIGDRIVADSEILGGKLTVKGTRISVEQVLEMICDEWSYQEILDNFPSLQRADIQACLNYARALVVKRSDSLMRSSKSGHPEPRIGAT